MAKRGRPSKYTDKLADAICARLAQGESIRTVCRGEDMPAVSTIFEWLRTKENFSEQYARAKEEAADAMAEEILDISDDGTNDWMERVNAEGEIVGWSLNGEHVQRSKLRVDSRKWLASKLKPKRYGDKQEVQHSGAVEFTFELDNAD